MPEPDPIATATGPGDSTSIRGADRSPSRGRLRRGALPGLLARRIEVGGEVLAPQRGGGVLPQVGRTGERFRQRIEGEEADVEALERVRGQLAAGGAAVEHQRVERDAGEAEAQAVEHGESRTSSHSMPVSSWTSLTATSAAE